MGHLLTLQSMVDFKWGVSPDLLPVQNGLIFHIKVDLISGPLAEDPNNVYKEYRAYS